MGLMNWATNMAHALLPNNPQTGDGRTTRDIYDKPRRPVFRDANGRKIKSPKTK